MEIIQFLKGHGGIETGKIFYYDNVKFIPVSSTCVDLEAEIALLKKAVSDGIEELFETGKHISVDIFSEEYENNGYAGAGYYVDDNGEKQIYRYAGYAAQAPAHVMGSISLKF